MSTRTDIEAWFALGESETLDFKATTAERKEGARALCAMLNHRGGRVLFGVTPGYRTLKNFQEAEVGQA